MRDSHEGVGLAYSWAAQHLSALAGLLRGSYGTGAMTRLSRVPAPSRGLIQRPPSLVQSLSPLKARFGAYVVRPAVMLASLSTRPACRITDPPNPEWL